MTIRTVHKRRQPDRRHCCHATSSKQSRQGTARRRNKTGAALVANGHPVPILYFRFDHCFYFYFHFYVYFYFYIYFHFYFYCHVLLPLFHTTAFNNTVYSFHHRTTTTLLLPLLLLYWIFSYTSTSTACYHFFYPYGTTYVLHSKRRAPVKRRTRNADGSSSCMQAQRAFFDVRAIKMYRCICVL